MPFVQRPRRTLSTGRLITYDPATGSLEDAGALSDIATASQRNTANGYAGLDGGGKLSASQFPSAFTIQLRRGTADEISSFVLAEGEPAYATDTKRVYVGDGSTAGGTAVGSNTFVVTAVDSETVDATAVLSDGLRRVGPTANLSLDLRTKGNGNISLTNAAPSSLLDSNCIVIGSVNVRTDGHTTGNILIGVTSLGSDPVNELSNVGSHIAIGNNADVSGEYSSAIAIGNGALSRDNCLVVGTSARAVIVSSTSLGNGALISASILGTAQVAVTLTDSSWDTNTPDGRHFTVDGDLSEATFPAGQKIVFYNLRLASQVNLAIPASNPYNYSTVNAISAVYDSGTGKTRVTHGLDFLLAAFGSASGYSTNNLIANIFVEPDTATDAISSIAIGRNAMVMAQGGTALGAYSRVVSPYTTNISGAIVTRRDAGDVANTLLQLSGTEVLLCSKIVDFTTTQTVNLQSLGTLLRFYPSETWVVCHTLSGTLTTQPTVQMGLSSSTQKHRAAAITTNLTTASKRDILPAVSPGTGDSGTLRASVTVAAAGSGLVMKGFFVWKGFLVEV